MSCAEQNRPMVAAASRPTAICADSSGALIHDSAAHINLLDALLGKACCFLN